MRKFIQNKLKDQKGLTLIELLAVIVILAIIAAIAIPAIGNIIDNSRVGAIKSDATNALNAAELFLADNPEHFTATVTTIDEADLIPGYLDESDAFTAFTIAEGDNQLVFTGTGDVSGVELAITRASKLEINNYANNNRASVVTTDGLTDGTIQATD